MVSTGNKCTRKREPNYEQIQYQRNNNMERTML